MQQKGVGRWSRHVCSLAVRCDLLCGQPNLAVRHSPSVAVGLEHRRVRCTVSQVGDICRLFRSLYAPILSKPDTGQIAGNKQGKAGWTECGKSESCERPVDRRPMRSTGREILPTDGFEYVFLSKRDWALRIWLRENECLGESYTGPVWTGGGGERESPPKARDQVLCLFGFHSHSWSPSRKTTMQPADVSVPSENVVLVDFAGPAVAFCVCCMFKRWSRLEYVPPYAQEWRD